MAEIKKVGVVGAGLMGHGIAQVAAQAGYDVVLREVDDEPAGEGHRQDREAARPRGREGQGRAGRRRRRARPHPGHDRLRRPRRLRPRDRGDHRGPRAQARDVARGRRDRQGRRVLRHQHLLAAGDRPGRRHQPPRPLPRPALLQPRAGDEAGRGRPLRHDLRRGLPGRPRLRQEARQARRPDPRQRGLHRQPPARALPARRDARLRGGRRLDHRDRRGDEGRRRAPDGAAHAARTSSASTRSARSAT